VDDKDEWTRLRLDFLRERVAGNGSAADYVEMTRELFRGYKSSGNSEYLAEAAALLEQARSKFPRSVPVWEHSVLYNLHYGTEQDIARSLSALSRLDPASPVIHAVNRPTDRVAWHEKAMDTAQQLLEDASSGDAAATAAAIAGLQEWARAYPRNSTYVINLSIGLMLAGRAEEARQVALSAAKIEDGSFADACNLGSVLAGTGDAEGALRFFQEALSRASSAEETAVARENIGKLLG
jgi:tetratricopeptide (TPR) repeat protein